MKLRRIQIRRGRFWAGGLLAALAVAVHVQGVAQETNRVVRPDYAAFKIISDRNIFNANRSGDARRSRREGTRASRVDAFRLVGIMEYDKGVFAFFDGTSADYRQALQAAGKIADYTVTHVTPDAVTLEAEGKKIELHVGTQVRREDDGEWQVAASGEPPAAAADSAAPAGGGSDTGGELSDVLKKLMQQREQEQK